MKSESLRLTAATSKLDEALEFVESCADRFGLEMKRKMGLAIAVEEAFVNVCNYAYPDEVGGVELECSSTGNDFVVNIMDEGVPFDVLSLDDPDTTASIEDRQIGGLGVFFIRKFTDEVSYRSVDGRNVLRLMLRNTD